MTRAAIVLCCGLSSACVQFDFLDLQLDDDQLAIIALSDDVGVRAAVRYPSAEPYRIDDATHVDVLIAETNDFVHPDGTALTPAELASMNVRPASTPAPSNSCGRCLAPFGHAPEVAHPGSSCRPPSFLELRPDDGDRARMEDVRDALRIDWPGDCACEEPKRSGIDPQTITFELAEPASTMIIDSIAQTDDGTLGLFAEHRAFFASADGTQRLYDPDAPIDGLVFGSAGIPAPIGSARASFLIASETGDRGGAGFSIASFEDGAVRYAPAELEGVSGLDQLRPFTVRRVHVDGRDQIAILGERIGPPPLPSIVLCDFAGLANGERGHCEVLLDALDCMLPYDFARTMIALADGTVIVGTQGGSMLTANRQPNGVWRSACLGNGDHVRVPSAAGLARIERFFALGLIEDRLYACAYFNDLHGGGGPAVITSSIASLAFSLVDIPGRDFSLPCSYFEPIDQRLRLTGGGKYLELDAHGALVAGPRPLSDVVAVGGAIDEQALVPDFRVLRVGNGSDAVTLEVRRRTVAGTYERILGPGDLSASPADIDGRGYALLIPDETGFYGLLGGSDGVPALMRIERTPAGLDVTDLHVEGLGDPEPRFTAGARDSRDGSLVLSVGNGRILRVDVGRKRATEVDTGGKITRAITAITELAPGKIILASEIGPLYLLTEEGISDIAIDDDPFAVSNQADTAKMHEAETSLGVAWLAGDQTRIARVRLEPGGASARGETFASLRIEAVIEKIDEHYFDAIHTLCPDRVLLGSEKVKLSAVSRDDARELGLVEFSEGTIDHRGVDGAYITAILGASSDATFVFDTRKVLRGGALAGDVPMLPYSGASIGEFMLLGGVNACLAFTGLPP